jgi:formyltetrahydrofolate deformylase
MTETLRPLDAPAPPPSGSNSSVQVLLVQCADRPGLVHAISGALFHLGVNVIGNQEYVDASTGTFYMRTEFRGQVVLSKLLADVRSGLPADAEVRYSTLAPKRIAVLASKEHHCLADILIRNAFDEFNARVFAVISNHSHLASLVQKFDVPFHEVPTSGSNSGQQEKVVLDILESLRPDYIVLAKYMRILSAKFCSEYPAQIINIHHSFLPAFVGAKPYHQAFDRGVKVIGATAHFVTSDLDGGPIIAQEVLPVNHTHTAEDLRNCGRNVEQVALARALKLVFEDRVMLCGNRTVIFE